MDEWNLVDLNIVCSIDLNMSSVKRRLGHEAGRLHEVCVAGGTLAPVS